jgi:hypothetical protein
MVLIRTSSHEQRRPDHQPVKPGHRSSGSPCRAARRGDTRRAVSAITNRITESRESQGRQRRQVGFHERVAPKKLAASLRFTSHQPCCLQSLPKVARALPAEFLFGLRRRGDIPLPPNNRRQSRLLGTMPAFPGMVILTPAIRVAFHKAALTHLLPSRACRHRQRPGSRGRIALHRSRQLFNLTIAAESRVAQFCGFVCSRGYPPGPASLGGCLSRLHFHP